VYQINLHFEGELGVSIESTFSHETARGSSDAQVIRMPVASSDLMGLLGHRVSGARGDATGTLVLVFDNGHTLRIFDDPHYEAYRICVGQKEIIV
jgi:hypothetical protein